MRSWRPAWVERLRILIQEAQTKCGAPNNAREIFKEMRWSKIFKQIETDADMKVALLGRAVTEEIRQFLKDGNTDIGSAGDQPRGISEEQLELWPAALRKTVEDIKRTRVFVPSRGEFVPMVPAEISRAETFEAGRYLKKLAAETDREGDLLIQLSAEPASDWT